MIKTRSKRCFLVETAAIYPPPPRVGKIAIVTALDFLKVLCFLFLVSVLKHKKF